MSDRQLTVGIDWDDTLAYTTSAIMGMLKKKYEYSNFSLDMFGEVESDFISLKRIYEEFRKYREKVSKEEWIIYSSILQLNPNLVEFMKLYNNCVILTRNKNVKFIQDMVACPVEFVKSNLNKSTLGCRILIDDNILELAEITCIFGHYGILYRNFNLGSCDCYSAIIGRNLWLLENNNTQSLLQLIDSINMLKA